MHLGRVHDERADSGLPRELGQLSGSQPLRRGPGWSRRAARGLGVLRGTRGRRPRRSAGRPARGRGGPGRAGWPSPRQPVPGRLEPQRGDAALEVGEQRLVGRLGVGHDQVGADVPRPARVGRPLVVSPSRSSGVPSGVMPMPSSVRPGQPVPDQLVGVLVGEPARLAQHGGGRGLPLCFPARSRRSSGAARSREPWSGSSASGSSSRPRRSAGRSRSKGRSRPPWAMNCDFLNRLRRSQGAVQRGLPRAGDRSNVYSWVTKERAPPADKISRPSSPMRSATSCWWAPARRQDHPPGDAAGPQRRPEPRRHRSRTAPRSPTSSPASGPTDGRWRSRWRRSSTAA